MQENTDCPCGSPLFYRDCCMRFHKGKKPATALDLMRSRYSAYALHLVDYIIDTTHPDNPDRKSNLTAWRKDLLRSARQTRFLGLKIWDTTEEGAAASVTFTASLEQNGREAGFTEKSFFEKLNDHWLYKSGEVQKTLR